MKLSAPSIPKVKELSFEDRLVTGLGYCFPFIRKQVTGKGLLNTGLRTKEIDLVFPPTINILCDLG